MAKMTDASMADAYRDEMTGISFTEEEKTNMAARLAAQMKTGETPAPGGKTNDAEIVQMRPSSRVRRPRRLAAAAVAAGLVLTIGFGGYAYASGQLVSVSDLVRQAFGGGPAETEIVNKVGRPVDAAVTHDGITVSADAVMGDEHSYVVVYSIGRTDGKPLFDLAEGSGTEGNQTSDRTMTLTDGRWLVPEVTQNADGSAAEGGAQWLYDADPTDNAIQLVIAYGTDTDVIGRTVHTTFSGIDAWDEEGGAEKLLSGTWDLSFKLDYESDDVTLGGGQRITLPETKTGATIKRVSVSSVAVTVDYTADATDVDDIPTDQPDGYWGGPTVLDLGDITVTLRDGTQIVVDGSGGSAEENAQGDTVCRMTNFLDRVIDPSDVASVTIGGQTIA